MAASTVTSDDYLLRIPFVFMNIFLHPEQGAHGVFNNFVDRDRVVLVGQQPVVDVHHDVVAVRSHIGRHVVHDAFGIQQPAATVINDQYGVLVLAGVGHMDIGSQGKAFRVGPVDIGVSYDGRLVSGNNAAGKGKAD